MFSTTRVFTTPVMAMLPPAPPLTAKVIMLLSAVAETVMPRLRVTRLGALSARLERYRQDAVSTALSTAAVTLLLYTAVSMVAPMAVLPLADKAPAAI